MSFSFRPAVREDVNLIIGLVSGTGGGKTFSAMRLATGICGDKPFAFIGTEAGRALHYADQFKFDYGKLSPPFTPDNYTEAIMTADKAGYGCIVVDSMSHVWAGDGGVLDWQEAEMERMAGSDWQKRERVKFAAWIKPKLAHKKMVQKLLQVSAHLILCFRAEEKIEIFKEGGKTKVRPKEGPTGLDGWIPVCEKALPFELTASFLMTADNPGVPKYIKCQSQHRDLFPTDRVIDERSGEGVRAWASTENPTGPAPTPDETPDAASVPESAKRAMFGQARKSGYADSKFAALRAVMLESFKAESTKDLTLDQVTWLVDYMKENPKEAANA